ncbi:putative metal-binding motif-containing protein [Cystobacter fuscus]
MNRVVPALLLVLWGCGGDRVALQALIQVDPQLPASCIALDVTREDGTVLQSQKLARLPDRQELRVAIFQGALPRDIQLQARALWGTACEEPLLANGWSAPVAARFEPTVGAVSLRLELPPPSLDADRDGFVSQAEGGPDCDDALPQSRPGVQELCDASADLNCDGLWGCDDATCSRRACSRTASALVFTSPERQGVAGECSPQPVVVERRDVLGQPAVPNHATALQLSASSLEATFYADAACRSSLVPTIPARASSLSFYVRGTRATSGLLIASSALGEDSLAHTLLPGPR